MGVAAGGHRHIHSPEEIELLIVESRDGGLLEPEEQHRLHQALRLSQRPASQLMVARLHMVTIDADASEDLVLKRVAVSPYSRFPVVRGSKDNIIGVLYIKDVIAHYIEHGRLPPVPQLMRPMLTVPRGVTADRLLALFREHRCQQAILVDEYGGIEGLVTLEDVLTEVFGDIADEFKLPSPEPVQLPDGRIRAAGVTRLDELQPLLGVPLRAEVATVGGLVSHVLSRLPVVGDRVELQGMAIEVERVSNRAVTSVLLTPPVRASGRQPDVPGQAGSPYEPEPPEAP
jgi:CBS domain containing-hemolysin-like protein